MTIRTIVLNYILLIFSSYVAVAALSTQLTLSYFFDLFADASGTTALLIASIMFGEENRKGLEETLRLSLRYAVILQGIMGIIAFLFAPQLVFAFTASAPEVADTAVICLRCYAIALPIAGVNVVLISCLQGIRRMKYANIMFACHSCVSLVIIAFVLGALFGAIGVWVAMPLSEIVIFASFTVASRHAMGHFPAHISDYLFITRDFGVPDEDQIELSVQRTDQVPGIIDTAFDFCISHGGDRHTADLIRHCVDEMVDNILTWGFSDGKPHNVDLRIVKKDDSFIIRIRDDCPAFNPQKQLQQHDTGNIEENLGIRMVYAMAKDVQYANTLHFNNVIITV